MFIFSSSKQIEDMTAEQVLKEIKMRISYPNESVKRILVAFENSPFRARYKEKLDAKIMYVFLDLFAF